MNANARNELCEALTYIGSRVGDEVQARILWKYEMTNYKTWKGRRPEFEDVPYLSVESHRHGCRQEYCLTRYGCENHAFAEAAEWLQEAA